MQHEALATQDDALESCLDCGAACLLGFTADACAEAQRAVEALSPFWNEVLQSRIARYTAWSGKMHQEGKLPKAGLYFAALLRCQAALDGLPSPKAGQRAHAQAAPASGAQPDASTESEAAEGAGGPAAAHARVVGANPGRRNAGARAAGQAQGNTSAKRGPRRARVNTEELD